MWRSRYEVSKFANVPLFNEPLNEWSQSRVDFVHCLEFFHSIRYCMEPPPDYIMDDDEALDTWLRNKKNKAEVEQRKTRLNQNPKTAGKSTMKMI